MQRRVREPSVGCLVVADEKGKKRNENSIKFSVLKEARKKVSAIRGNLCGESRKTGLCAIVQTRKISANRRILELQKQRQRRSYQPGKKRPSRALPLPLNCEGLSLQLRVGEPCSLWTLASYHRNSTGDGVPPPRVSSYVRSSSRSRGTLSEEPSSG